MPLPARLRPLAALGVRLLRHAGLAAPVATGEGDPEAAEIMRRARDAQIAGYRAEARALFRHVAERWPAHLPALHGLRDLAAEARDWAEVTAVQERVLALAPAPDERTREAEWLAVAHYERGRAALAGGDAPGAIGYFRAAVRADRQFVPGWVALGDAQEAAGDHREAMRTWERAADSQPALPLLARLEHAHRQEGRPSRMISLYRAAAERAPDDLALTAALGRVYFELEMLDEAADQFEKLEVQVPDQPVVHAFLGAVFERRGDTRDAFEEYRRALRLARAFDWPHRCQACGAVAPTWLDRCARCGRWNTLLPVHGR